MSILTIRTPSRLHFGLFGWGPRARRQFGGVGLMTADPGLELRVEPASHLSAVGPHAARAEQIASAVSVRLAETGHPVGPVRIAIVRAPQAHVGLGVGTQLSLAVAWAVAELAGWHDAPGDALARISGRGQRSGIGIHGFARGGLIVDAGRSQDHAIPTPLMALPFPADWSILIVIPQQTQGLHGADELRAFRDLPEMPASATDRLCGLVLLGLLPAVIDADLEAFGRALSEIQSIVGASFSPAQGGPFASSGSELIVNRMKSLGLQGVGQSSWGPALYGFSADPAETRDRVRRLLMADFDLREADLFWTAASPSGATLSRLEGSDLSSAV